MFSGFCSSQPFGKVKSFLEDAGINLSKLRHLFFTKESSRKYLLGVVTYCSYADELKNTLANLHASSDKRFHGISLASCQISDYINQRMNQQDTSQIQRVIERLDKEIQTIHSACKDTPKLYRTTNFLKKTYHDSIRVLSTMDLNTPTAQANHSQNNNSNIDSSRIQIPTEATITYTNQY